MKKAYVYGAIAILLLVIIWSVFGRDSTETKTLKIGVLIPLSGTFAQFGEDIRNGLELAKAKAETDLGVGIEFFYENSESDAKKSLPAAQKLVSIDKVDLIIAGPGSTANLVVAPFMENEKVPFVAISSTSRLNTAGRYVIKAQRDIDAEAKKIAEYISDSKLRSAAILYDLSSDTMTIGRDVFSNRFKELGGRITTVEAYDSKSSAADYKTQLTKIKAANPEAVYLLANAGVGGIIVKQARKLGLMSPLFGFSGLQTQEFLEAAGDSAEDVIFTALPFSCQDEDAMKDYCKRYAERFNNRVALQYGAHAYDIANILANESVKNPNLDSEDIVSAFTDKSYSGINGKLTFDSDGNILADTLVIRTVKNGQYVTITPGENKGR